MNSSGLSIIIPARNEALAGWTIRNLLRTADVPLDIILVDDGSDSVDYAREVEALGPEVRASALPASLTVLRRARYAGNGPSRDWGIESAAFDACCILDAHCDFRDGDRWASRALAWQAAHPTEIGCAVSVKLNADITSMSDPRAKAEYWGAWIEPQQITSRGEHRVMQGVWSRDLHRRTTLGYSVDPATGRTTGSIDPAAAPVETGCIMGGCYFLSRDHYLDRLSRIWSHLRTWGSSEPAICLVQWLAGHGSWLLPIECGHVYRSGQQHLVPWSHRPCDVLHNQIAVAAIAYADDRPALDAAMAHLSARHGAFRDGWKLAENGGIFNLAQSIDRAKRRTWPEHLKRWREK